MTNAPKPSLEQWRTIGIVLLTVLVLCLMGRAAHGEIPKLDGWVLEQGVDVLSYAVTEPASTNLNIDTIALVCEEADNGRIAQLQLYLADEAPLSPKGVPAARLKSHPRAEVVIDRRIFPVQLLFADDYVLVADSQRDRYPMLSNDLLSAMATGGTMTLRFDLVAENPGQPAAFDGEALIYLQAGRGGAAVNAIRRCANEPQERGAEVARAP